MSDDDVDAELIAVLDGRLADPSGSAQLPAVVSGYILGGLGLIEALRMWRGLPRSELARVVRISDAELGEIETGGAPGG